MSLFRHDPFTSHSGRKLDVKIECDALTEEDWEALAFIAAKHIGSFRTALGVPRGGVPFARALLQHPHDDHDFGLPTIICDDVYTTGNSMNEYKNNYCSGLKVKGIVAFSRAATIEHLWITALFSASVMIP